MDETPRTISVPEAGKQYFGLGRNASYDAAKRGEIPVIRIGGRLRAIVAALEKMVSANDAEQPHRRKFESGRVPHPPG
jgi:hypothetical protein